MKKSLKIFFLSIIIMGCTSPSFLYKKEKLTYSNMNYGYNVKYFKMDDNIGKIAYIDEGKGEKTLLFIHGVGAYLKYFYYQIKYFSKKFRVIALDMPGYGKSTFNPNVKYTPDLHIKSIKKFINQKKLKNLVIIGHSYGTVVSSELSLDSNLNVKKTILLTAPGLQLLSKRDYDWFDSNLEKILKNSVMSEDKIINSWKNRLVFLKSRITNEYLIDLLNLNYSGDFVRKTVPVRNQIVLQFLNYKNTLSRIQNYKKIKNPILIIAGENDELYPRLSPITLTKNTPENFYNEVLKFNLNSKVVLLKNCGHMVPIEQPDEVNRIILDFINKK